MLLRGAAATEALLEILPFMNVLCTVSAAHEPILRVAGLAPGQHINRVAANVSSTCEANDDGVRRRRYFVAVRSSAAVQPGEWLQAVATGVMRADYLQRVIGEVLLAPFTGGCTRKT